MHNNLLLRGGRIIRNSGYFSVVVNFALVMALMTVCRLLFWAFNADLFPGVTAIHAPAILAGGLLFDLSAAVYGNALWLLLLLLPCKAHYTHCYQSVCKGIFIAFNTVLLAANCLDFIYFRYTLRRTTMSIFNEFSNEQHFLRLVGGFMVEYWYVFLLWFAMIAVLVLCYRTERCGVCNVCAGGRAANIKFYGAGTVILLIFSALSIIAMRGGLRNKRPISPNHAIRYAPTPMAMAIVQNTPFAMLRTHKASINTAVYFTDRQELERYYTPVHCPAPADSFSRKNIVILICESLGKELSGALNRDIDSGRYKGFTPFLDSLIPHSLTFTHSYANGRRSVEAVPSIAISIPSLSSKHFTETEFSQNRLLPLPALLHQKGYESAFFHGCFNGSMKIDECAAVAGFEKYYGKTEYANDADYDGAWGIYDEEFLQFFAAKMGQMREPFITAVFTQSNHGPNKIPPRYDDRWRWAGKQHLRSVLYSDYAVRRFFETAQQAAWFRNTIFVIVADHSTRRVDPSPSHGEYSTSVGQMAIPIIYYAGDGSLCGLRRGITQQTDIMPTILSLLNYDKPYLAFGRNALETSADSADTGIAVNYINGIYQLFCGKYVLLHNGERALGLYDLYADKLLKHNLLGDAFPQIADIANLMELQLKAFIQQYSERLLHNQLTADADS